MSEKPTMSEILRLRIPSSEIGNLRAFCTLHPNGLVITDVRKSESHGKLPFGTGDTSEVLLMIYTVIVLTDLSLLIYRTIKKIEAKRIRLQSIRGIIDLTEKQPADEIERLLRGLLSGGGGNTSS